MTRRNSLHYCYDVSYQCWFTSEEAKIYCYNFNSSNAVLSNSCVLCTTRCNKCGRIGTKWLFFFTFIEECCVVIEKNIDKKLANRISYQIWYKRCLNGWSGVQICEGGSISASGFGPGGGGSNPLWHWGSLIPLFKSQFGIIFSILFRACIHSIVDKKWG